MSDLLLNMNTTIALLLIFAGIALVCGWFFQKKKPALIVSILVSLLFSLGLIFLYAQAGHGLRLEAFLFLLFNSICLPFLVVFAVQKFRNKG